MLRALHLGKGKEAQFLCTIVLVDVLNIPFVTGAFKVQWKFKAPASSHAEHGSGQLTTVEWPLHEQHALSRSNTREDATPSKDRSRSGSLPKDTVKLKQVDAHEVKGTTEPSRLRAHVAHFHRIVTCPVTLSISKSGLVEPCEVKLVVRQESHTESGKLEEHKLGVVTVDLSDFISEHSGAARKPHTFHPMRFLLAESKTNALLRLHIDLEFIGGDPHFTTKTELKREERARQASNSSGSGSGSTPSNVSSASSDAHARDVGASLPESSAASVVSLLSASSLIPAVKPPSVFAPPATEGLIFRSHLAGETSAADVIDSLFAQVAPSGSTSATHSLHHKPSNASLQHSHAHHHHHHHRVPSTPRKKNSTSPTRSRNSSPTRSPSRSFLSLPLLGGGKCANGTRPSSVHSTESQPAPRKGAHLKPLSIPSHSSDTALMERGREHKPALSPLPTTAGQPSPVRARPPHSSGGSSSSVGLSAKGVRFTDPLDPQATPD